VTTVDPSTASQLVHKGQAGRGSVWALAALLGATLSTDWLLPLTGPATYLPAAALSVLLVPWAISTLRFASSSDADHHDPRRAALGRSRRLHGFLLRVALVALTISFLVAKWSVLLAADGSDTFASASRSYSLGLMLMTALGLAARDLRASRFLASASLHPARLMALSFGGVGLAGTLLLSLPFSHRDFATVSLIDNLFTAFSAVCVTGLTTVNLAETYSFSGQLIILGLIQAGGLGIMVLSAAIAIMSGQKLRLKSSVVLTEVVDGASLATLKRTVVFICAVTLALETLGTAVLYASFRQQPGLPEATFSGTNGAGLWWAASFHAVSAFCNAGMSVFSEGAVRFAERPLVLAVLGLLVVVGGLGFPVLSELVAAFWQTLRGRKRQRLSLHARVVLRTSWALLLATTAGYLLLEWTASLSPLGYVDRAFAAAFQAAVARTGGFNAVDIASMLPATWLLTCAAMFIGAAPGSTGGGIKVTTLVALFSGLRAELGTAAPRLLDRALPDSVVRKAIGVALLSLTIVLVAFFALLLLERHPPLELAFEAVSAFSTTGLSTGITPKLSAPGKLLVAALMFAGRIGPLTLALALSTRSEASAVRLPEERVLIG
jgi:trk system potassium uptake protein